MKTFFSLILACATLSAPAQSLGSRWFHATAFTAQDFQSPSLEYAPFTRWWWPGNDVTTEELKREVALFAQQHIGGAEIQPMSLVMPCKGKGRADRIMSFDTPDYYQHLSAVMDAAQQNGLIVDLTDGSGWPAGGTHISEQENNQTLEVGVADLKPSHYIPVDIPHAQRGDRPSAKLVAVLVAKMTGTEGTTLLLDKSSVRDITASVKDGKVAVPVKSNDYKLIAFWQVADMERPMLMASRDAGFSMNHFDSTVVAKNYDHFLGSRTGLGKYMGHPLRALFNDSYEFRADRHFSDDFIKTFRQNRGYDPIPYLPANIWYGYNNMYDRMAHPGQQPSFAFDANDWRLRYDYDLTISDLLRRHFLNGSRHWLESRGMLHRTQTYGLNMDIMGAAGDASIPEMETMIFAKASEGGMKMISSGAHLYNRPIVSCETAVYFGRAFLTTPQKLKMTVDKVLSSGVNQIVWHGTPYRYFPDGYPKEGWYPFFNNALGVNFSTFFSEKNPFWPEFRDINIYAQRAQYLMRCGKPQADVLIYYPFLKFSEDAYNPRELLISGYLPNVEPEPAKDDSRPFNSDTESNWLKQIWTLIDELNRKGITWDWVNDESLQSATAANEGNINIRGNQYKGLILFHLPYMQLNTAKALDKLAQQGTRMITIGDLPQQQPSYHEWQQADKETRQAITTLAALPSVTADPHALDSLHLPLQSMTDLDCIKQTRRVLADGSILQMYWNESKKWRQQTIQVNDNKFRFFYWLNAEDGSMTPAKPDVVHCLEHAFAPLASAFLLCSPQPADNLMDTAEKGKKQRKKETVAFNPAQATLVMDMPQWDLQVDSLPTGKSSADASAGKSLSLDHQSLKDWRADSLLRYNGQPCTYTLLTKIKRNRSKHYFLDLGQVYYMASLTINGQNVGKRVYAPYVFDVTPYLRKGHNMIVITVKPSMYNELVKRGIDGNRLFKRLKDTGIAAEGLAGPVRLYEQ